MFVQNFGEGGGGGVANKSRYGLCKNGEWKRAGDDIVPWALTFFNYYYYIASIEYPGGFCSGERAR